MVIKGCDWFLKFSNSQIKGCDWFLKFLGVVRFLKFLNIVIKRCDWLLKFLNIVKKCCDWFLKSLNIVIKCYDWLSLHGDVRLIVGFIVSLIQFFRHLNKTNSWRKLHMSNIISNKFTIPKPVRPQLVKSLVIVIYFFETEMRDAVIINY